MARINPIRHHPIKCACTSDAPAFGSRKAIKRKPNDNGRILSSRDDGTMIGHNDITFVGQDA